MAVNIAIANMIVAAIKTSLQNNSFMLVIVEHI